MYDVVGGEELENKHVLVVDDVLTTGATLMSCAVVLRKAGAAEVSAITLARSGKEEHLPNKPLQKN